MHLNSFTVTKGESASANQLIGYVGNSGTSAVHLHFSISKDGLYYSQEASGIKKFTDPLAYFD